MMKEVHCVINLAGEMSILLQIVDEDGAASNELQKLQVSCLCKITSISLVKPQSRKFCL